MKRLIVKWICCMLGTGIFPATQAQFSEVDFLKGGMEDAEILFSSYLSPWAKAFGTNLNAGWYTTAKTHETGGFDIFFSLTGARIPSSEKTMELSTLALSAVISPGENGYQTPTLAGELSATRPALAYPVSTSPEEQTFYRNEYTAPNGSGFRVTPTPVIQAGIGLPLGTEIIGRFIPDFNIGKAGNVSLWGAGLKHDILQYFHHLKKIPILNASIQGGYTSFASYANVNFYPENYGPEIINQVDDMLVFKDQKIKLKSQAWTLNLIVSQTFPGISFYQSVGYGTSQTQLLLCGIYPFTKIHPETSSGMIDSSDECLIKDPVNQQLSHLNNIRLNAGIRLKLGVLTLHFDYTQSHYPLLSTGIGLSFR